MVLGIGGASEYSNNNLNAFSISGADAATGPHNESRVLRFASYTFNFTRRAEKRDKMFSHTTPRTLLGVVRLAQALACLRFSNEVSQDDVDEALRLIEFLKESLAVHESTGGRRTLNAASRIYNLVKALANSGACCAAENDDDEEGTVELSMRKIRERVLAKGFTEDQRLSALEEYTNLDVSSICSLSNSRRLGLAVVANRLKIN
ncbi:hypothetical protein F4782DRAFT_535119 [Xylaria castorea]|nr:hypothetical protein F4782DRAFT_535119 [Xylaria castorea]